MTPHAIRDIWARELDLDPAEISDDDDFFALGGHSMLMARIQTGIQESFGVEIAMDDLFRHATVARISRHLEGRLSTVPSGG